MELLLALVALLATTIGALSGMGGGIIIKPVMDAVSGLDVAVIHFMSGCTVLTMSVVSVYRGRKDGLEIGFQTSLALALGACVGGVIGKALFDLMTGHKALLQSLLLLGLNLGIYVYIQIKHKLHTLQVKHLGVCGLIGGGLGTLSSFLGIGGGPINIAVLHFFFSSPPKVTAKRSIFIILLSQTASFATVMVQGLPQGVNYVALGLMMVGGCSGALLGGNLSKKMQDTQVEAFFTHVLVGILMLNAFNVGRLL